MNKKIIGFGIILIILAVGLSGCTDNIDIGANRPEEFIGTWKRDSGSEITFFKDGECSYIYSKAGTWEVKDGKLVIEVEDSSLVFDYKFSYNNQKLELTKSDVTYTYTKQ